MMFGQITNVILKLVSPLISRTKTTESETAFSEPLVVDLQEIDNKKASDLLYDPDDEFPDWSEQELRAEEILRYGTTAGSKAKKNYVFYITDEKKYVVVYFAYWCL